MKTKAALEVENERLRELLHRAVRELDPAIVPSGANALDRKIAAEIVADAAKLGVSPS